MLACNYECVPQGSRVPTEARSGCEIPKTGSADVSQACVFARGISTLKYWTISPSPQKRLLLPFFWKRLMSSNFLYTTLAMDFGCSGNCSESTESVFCSTLCPAGSISLFGRSQFPQMDSPSLRSLPTISTTPSRIPTMRVLIKERGHPVEEGKKLAAREVNSLGKLTIRRTGLSNLCQELSFSCYIMILTNLERKMEGEGFSKRWTGSKVLPTVVYIL